MTLRCCTASCNAAPPRAPYEGSSAIHRDTSCGAMQGGCPEQAHPGQAEQNWADVQCQRRSDKQQAPGEAALVRCRRRPVGRRNFIDAMSSVRPIVWHWLLCVVFDHLAAMPCLRGSSRLLAPPRSLAVRPEFFSAMTLCFSIAAFGPWRPAGSSRSCPLRTR